MTTPVTVDPFDSAAAKARRLRMFTYLLVALAVGLVVTSSMSWYRFEYTSSHFAGQLLETRPVIDVDPGKMAEISREISDLGPFGVQNPQVSQLINYPVFVLAPLIGIAITLAGLWLRSAALSALGLLGHFWGWVHLGRSKWWFESAPGRENWSVNTSAAQGLFWFCLLLAVFATIAGSIQAFLAYRAFRSAKAASGQTVEESASEMFVRLITRAALNRTNASPSK